MEPDNFKHRLARAIAAQIPEDANRGAWYFRQAVRLDISEKRLRTYAAEEHECPGSVLLRMFSHFGADFEAAVRGEAPASADERLAATKAMDALSEALDGLRAQANDGPAYLKLRRGGVA